MKLRIQRIARFDARKARLRRSSCPGIDIYDGRRRASAEIWNQGDKETLIRFTTGPYMDHFRVILPDGTAASGLTCEQMEQLVHPALADWFYEACDDSFE